MALYIYKMFGRLLLIFAVGYMERLVTNFWKSCSLCCLAWTHSSQIDSHTLETHCSFTTLYTVHLGWFYNILNNLWSTIFYLNNVITRNFKKYIISILDHIDGSLIVKHHLMLFGLAFNVYLQNIFTGTRTGKLTEFIRRMY